MDEKQRNNAQWCCDQIEELIETYKQISKNKDYNDEVRLVYEKIIKDLENILYE